MILDSLKKKAVWSKIKRRFLKHIWLARISLLLGILAGLYLVFLLLVFLLGRLGLGQYFGVAGSFLFTPKANIAAIDNRTNILILGKSGQGYQAPDLTDTIVFASLDHLDKSITLVSLPRDIWVPSIRAKINSAYFWGNQRAPGGGLVLAKSLAEEVVGVPINYAIVIDFSVFRRVVDALGGIEVNVERSFVDQKFPIAGKENDDCGGDPEFKCRYETINFSQGLTRMNGEMALKFVRSRNAEGDEGTDIAREARQQKVIAAIKKEILQPRTWLNPVKVFALLRVARESIETDLKEPAAAILIRRVLQSRDKIRQFVLPEEFLVNPPISQRYDNQYVFLPKEGDWSNVHGWVEKNLP